MTRKLWFQTGIAILLAFLIIKYFLEIKFIFSPIVIIIKTASIPLIFGGVLYYLAEPLQRWLETKNFPRWGSISIILICLVGVLSIFIAFIAPIITKEFKSLVDNTPELTKKLDQIRSQLVEQKADLPEQVRDIMDDIGEKIKSTAVTIGGWVLQFVQTFVQAIVSLVLVPFFFFFMLKDHEKFAPIIYNLFHGERRTWVKQTLEDIDQVLRAYVQGQLLISAILASIILIGYLIIGLDYAILLAIFALFMNVIPFLGPWIAFTPALIIAYVQDPKLMIWVSVVTLVAQQIEGQLITPNVMGKKLDIHPLTVITLIIAAGSIAGFFGILLAIPTYAVIKVVASNIYQTRKKIRQAATKNI